MSALEALCNATIGGGKVVTEREKITPEAQENKAETVLTSAAGNQPADQSEEDPATAKARRELAKLTPEALIDDLLGLRADLAESGEPREVVMAAYGWRA